MSGKPNKTENDIIRHKNEYIERLNLESEINKKNYDANKLYKETGQVMPIIGLNDNRSIEDKLLDTEKLKQDISKTIGTISSLTFGIEVVQAIQENPLNIDNKLLIFTAQRINEIILNLKKIYAIGIRGDKNDVQQLVNFIVKMYTDANAFTQTAKNFVNTQPSGALNPTGSPNIGAMQNVKTTITGILPYFGQFLDEYTTQYQIFPNNVTNPIMETNIMDEFEEAFQIMTYLISFCLTPQQYNHILDISKDYNFGNMAIQQARLMIERLSEIFPQPNTMQTFFQKNKKYFKIADTYRNLFNEYNLNGVNGPYYDSIRSAYLTSLDKLNEVLLNFLGLLNPHGWTLFQFDDAYLRMQDFFRTYGDGGNNNPPPGGAGPPPVGARGPPPAPPNIGIVRPPPPMGGAPPLRLHLPPPLPPPQAFIQNEVNNLTSVQLDQLYQDIPNRQGVIFQSPAIQGLFVNPQASQAQKRISCTNALQTAFGPTYDPQNGVGNFGINGLGISTGNGITKRRRGRPKGSGVLKPYSQTVQENLDLTRGIEPSGKFIKFGKYLLNSHKLNKENMFSLKHISGGNIIDIPSTRLTDGLGKVIKTIIGGGNPHFNDLNGLSENEQNYLHKVCSKSNIADKLSIPTPSKDAQEKEIHKFEVMKGEISSGNDSPELIKDFKRMIMKLQKNNSLPKKEVYEILEELNSLGY